VHRDGKRHGEFSHWLTNRTRVVAVTYRRGERHGPAQAWHPQGTLATRAAFAHGKLTGHCIEWDAAGNKTVEADYDRGVWKRFYPSGGIGALVEIDATGSGEVTAWEVRQCKFTHSQFRNYKLHGTQTFFRDCTFAYDRREFEHGLPHGVWTTWHAPGVKRSEVRFEEGVPGPSRRWDESGKPERE
jgi:antitoxin component YwqK of YwqJK toxin-antitoxin module